jgi:hypothetical protein
MNFYRIHFGEKRFKNLYVQCEKTSFQLSQTDIKTSFNEKYFLKSFDKLFTQEIKKNKINTLIHF